LSFVDVANDAIDLKSKLYPRAIYILNNSRNTFFCRKHEDKEKKSAESNISSPPAPQPILINLYSYKENPLSKAKPNKLASKKLNIPYGYEFEEEQCTEVDEEMGYSKNIPPSPKKTKTQQADQFSTPPRSRKLRDREIAREYRTEDYLFYEPIGSNNVHYQTPPSRKKLLHSSPSPSKGTPSTYASTSPGETRLSPRKSSKSREQKKLAEKQRSPSTKHTSKNSPDSCKKKKESTIGSCKSSHRSPKKPEQRSKSLKAASPFPDISFSRELTNDTNTIEMMI
jgi:hypothetical protein